MLVLIRLFALLWLNVTYSIALAQSEYLDPQEIPTHIKRIIDGHELPLGSYSFSVREIGKAESVLTINPNALLNPASTIKVLTTLTALEELGPAYTWHTNVYALGPIVDNTLHGDLLIQGGGDPFLVVDKFWHLLKALKRKGITSITGNLIIDQSYFHDNFLDPAAFDGQKNRTYNVLPSALLINFQAITFYFRPHQNGQDVIITSNPKLANLTIDNRLQLTSGSCSGFQRGIAFDTSTTSADTVIFSGSFPSSCGEYSMPRAVLTAPTYAFGLFQQLWKEIGGEFDGKLVLSNSSLPELQAPLLSWPSVPLRQVITSINKFSNNVMVRQLLLTLAAKEFTQQPATVANGIKVIKDYLNSKNIDSSQFTMVNGAGLSRETRISTKILLETLLEGASIPFTAEYISSLPIGGLDGTMRERFKGTAAEGQMHIKTGSLAGASAIAGYVNAQSGKHYAVVGILNHKLAHRGPGSELMNSLLEWVYQQ